MTRTRKQLESLMDRPVAIFGAGVTGRSVERFLKNRGVDAVFYDERPHLTSEAVNDFLNAPTGLHGLAVVSPGFSNDHPWLEAAREMALPCIGDLDLGTLYWKGKIMAITGTNGKSTTTMLLEEAMRASGMDATACGNIGKPLLDFVDNGGPESWAVVEVSSFQAELMSHFACDAAIWTNFDEDHLSRHRGLKPYFQAKANVLKHRRGREAPAFVGPSVGEVYQHFGMELPHAVEVVPCEEHLLEGLKTDSLFINAPQSENFSLARALWNHFEFNPRSIIEAGNEMKPLPHRLQWLGEAGGIQFWNDSKATNFSATLAALERFDQPVYWIGGGRYKGGDLERFARKLGPQIGRAYLLGEIASELSAHCRQQNIPVVICDSLEIAVNAAYRHARGPSDILFSPGFSSHDAWTSYAERGNAFRALARRFIEPALATTPT